ncbi:delta(14)-sterol reductase LBR-like [Adelges cooleyi]|uniref:delta(14)-sterol reductase LBR-like n=1 Tax=Adelges cooleyi TaxID=133065 RepID=UPI00217FB7C8|nr:delta(14)-sterol reductase LBR-like [Adelges cooleyi]
MLTRRSRREAVDSPSDSTTGSRVVSPKSKTKKDSKSKSPSKYKKVTPTRSKSKSVERKIRPRSRSAAKKVPKLVLEKIDISEQKASSRPKRNKSVESPTFKKSPTPSKTHNNSRQSESPFKSNDITTSGLRSRLILDKTIPQQQPSNIAQKSKTTQSTTGKLVLQTVLALLFIAIVGLAKIAVETKGNLIPFPRGYLKLANYYNEQVFIASTAIVLVHFVIASVPLFWKTNSLGESEPRSYRFSGFINLLLVAGIVVAMVYTKCPIISVLKTITIRTVPNVVVSTFCALFLSIVLTVKSKFINRAVDYKGFYYTLLNGTNNNNTLGPINVKLTLYRYSALMTILYNGFVLLNSGQNSENLYLLAGAQIFISVDKLLFEYHLLSSYYLQRENVGFLTVLQYFLLPAINFLPIQIVLANPTPVNYIVLGFTAVGFLVGYLIQRDSDRIKYKYKSNTELARNPSERNNVLFVNGRKIIVGRCRSFVRFPNYLGTILAHLSLTLGLISMDLTLNRLQVVWPVFLYSTYYILTLGYRSKRVVDYCKSQYGYLWENEYATKSNLVPKIF